MGTVDNLAETVLQRTRCWLSDVRMSSSRNRQLRRIAQASAAGKHDHVPVRRGLDWARRIELASVLIAAAVGAVGLWYSNAQVREELAISRDQLVINRYTAAVTNLSDDALEVRLGGIYTLERLMADSPQDQPTIVNVLATYIRTHAPVPPDSDPHRDQGFAEDLSGEHPDVYAAATVLADRDPGYDGGFVAHLAEIQLPSAYMNGADFENATFDHSELAGARFVGAHLDGANFDGANLAFASFQGARLIGADFVDANLEMATFYGADLTDADISVEQLITADIDSTTILDRDLAFDPQVQAQIEFGDWMNS